MDLDLTLLIATFMDSFAPETQVSLILRLQDKLDIEAWGQFVQIYEPLVYRLAKTRGFQEADAREIVQEVLMSVSRSVEDWDPDKEQGRFRDWLFIIARNLMIKFLTRRKYRTIGSGDSRIFELLNQQIAPDPESAEEFDLEFKREVFRVAARKVREQVRASTWSAFALTSLEGKSTERAAEELGMTAGAIHIARSRVRGRLRREIKNISLEGGDV